MINQATFFVFSLAVLLFSAILHEVSHGFSAKLQGDDTAEAAGRLTLNPLPHLDPFGSILLPLILIFTGSPIVLGWAKPVPFNPNNLRNRRWGPAWVAAAGPITNAFVALVFGLIIRIGAVSPALSLALAVVVLYNILLAVFNLIPIPPLDGSRILFSFLPYRWQNLEFRLEQYGFIIVIFLLYFDMIFGLNMLQNAVFWLFNLVTGQSFLL